MILVLPLVIGVGTATATAPARGFTLRTVVAFAVIVVAIAACVAGVTGVGRLSRVVAAAWCGTGIRVTALRTWGSGGLFFHDWLRTGFLDAFEGSQECFIAHERNVLAVRMHGLTHEVSGDIADHHRSLTG